MVVSDISADLSTLLASVATYSDRAIILHLGYIRGTLLHLGDLLHSFITCRRVIRGVICKVNTQVVDGQSAL